MTPKEARELKKLIAARVATAIQQSWIGTLPPEDRKHVEKERSVAKQNLEAYIKELTK